MTAEEYDGPNFVSIINQDQDIRLNIKLYNNHNCSSQKFVDNLQIKYKHDINSLYSLCHIPKRSRLSTVSFSLVSLYQPCLFKVGLLMAMRYLNHIQVGRGKDGFMPFSNGNFAKVNRLNRNLNSNIQFHISTATRASYRLVSGRLVLVSVHSHLSEWAVYTMTHPCRNHSVYL